MLTVALGAPGVTGVIAKVEARLQGRRGPRVLQPYYDLAKLFRKEALAPEQASWFFLAAPLIAVTCYLTIPLLIPVLTSYRLPLGHMGDILGGGFLLSLAGVLHTQAELHEVMMEEHGRDDGSGPPDRADPGEEEAAAHLRYASDVMEVVENYFYRPALGFFTSIVTAAKRLQSGRLDAYLLYMLIALIAVIAVVTALA